jgi:hypothetical protein
MQHHFSKSLESINNLSLVEYLEVLGIEPIAVRAGQSEYRSPFDEDSRSTMTVYHDSNRFQDFGSGLSGTLSDFVCHLFGSSPEEVSADVVRHRLYLVKTKVAAQP